MVFPPRMDQADIKKLLNSVGCTPKKIQVGQQAIHVWFWAPDFKARANTVELAYKIKGRLITKIEPPDDMPGLFNPAAELPSGSSMVEITLSRKQQTAIQLLDDP